MNKILFGVILVVFIVLSQCVFSQSIGVVDYTKIMSDSPLVKSVYADLDKESGKMQTELTVRKASPFLTETEVNELIGLVASKANDARVKELQALNTTRSTELVALQQKNPLNDTEKTRNTELTDMKKKSETNISNKAASFDESFNKILTDKEKQMEEKVVAACKAVAEEKKLSMILQKGVVLYGGVDVTAEVVSKLPASL